MMPLTSDKQLMTHTHTHLTWFDFSFFYSSQNIFMVDRQDILNLTDTTD